MVIDTTLSFFSRRLDTCVSFIKSNTRRKQSQYPWGAYESKKERSEFRQLFVREFLERNGRDSDIDLENTIVFWKNGDVVAVTGLNSDSQNISELLEL